MIFQFKLKISGETDGQKKCSYKNSILPFDGTLKNMYITVFKD